MDDSLRDQMDEKARDLYGRLQRIILHDGIGLGHPVYVNPAEYLLLEDRALFSTGRFSCLTIQKFGGVATVHVYDAPLLVKEAA